MGRRLLLLAATLGALGGGVFAVDANAADSPGCGANKLNSGDASRTLNIGGKQRGYALHIPKSYNGKTALPLIIDYHGYGGNGAGQRGGSGFANQSEDSGFIVAYPDAVGGAWNYKRDTGEDDMGFTRGIVNDLASQGCVDTSRVYAAGFSMGGGMSYRDACQAADVFAAVVSSSFDFYQGQQCNPSRPISVLSFRGDADGLAIYGGSAGFDNAPFVGAKETLRLMAAVDHCSGSPKIDSDGCEIYTNCDGGTQVGLCTIRGGGHLSGDPRTSWDFLKQFSLASGNSGGNSGANSDGSSGSTSGGNSGSGSNGSASDGGNSSTNDGSTNSSSGDASSGAIKNGRYNIVSSLTDMNLDVFGARKDDGTSLIQYNKHSGSNQQFDVEALGDGTYSIRAAHSGKSLDVYQWNANDGAELRQWTYHGGTNQRWRIADTGGGLYSITSAYSGKVLDVWEMNRRSGGAVKLYHWLGGANQKWKFVQAGSSDSGNNNGNNDNGNNDSGNNDSGNNDSGNNGGNGGATEFSLSVGVSGKGTTDLSIGGHTYKSGSMVTIKATPDAGYEFAGWSGAFTGNTNPLTITVDGNKTLTATFTAKASGGGGNTPTDMTRVANPYVGANRYIDPEWSGLVKESANRASGDLKPAIAVVAQQPTSVWLDRIAALDSLPTHLDAAVQQQATKGGSTPMLIELVVYDLPDRDCAALASNGELKVAQNGLARYKTEYIDRIVEMLQSKSEYKKLRIVTVVEPDSLPNVVTNMSLQSCATAAPAYKEGVAYAIKKLATLNNVYIYLDMAHSGWLGWEHGDKAAQVYKEVMAAAGGENLVRGFATNVANYSALAESFNPYDNQSMYQSLIVDWYEWNRMIDEKTYVDAMRGRFPNHRFLIDTGRNGWKAQASGTPIENRIHRGNWCNNKNAGLGERPKAEPMAGVDAFVWIKPPGASDGTSNAAQTTPDAEGKQYDPMCGTDAVARSYSKGKAIPTDALSGAPAAGKWFDAHFFQLVRNATPAVDTNGGNNQNGGDQNGGNNQPTPTAPAEPASLGGSMVNGAVVLTWSDKSSNEQGFLVERRVSNASTWTTLTKTSANVMSYTDGTATAGNTYEYRVSAFNATGNSAAIATSVMVPKAADPLPTAPSGLTANVIDNGTVNLAWSDNSGNEAGFRVERRVAGDAAWTKLADTGANTKTYSDASVPMGKSYEYRVSAYNATGSSAAATASATLQTFLQYGEKMYKDGDVMLCSACHGADAKKKLKSHTAADFAAMVKEIEDTMPDDTKRLCVNNCAKGTAAYIIKLQTGVTLDENGR